MQLCLQNFYSNTIFQRWNFKYFFRILEPFIRATKFKEISKTAVLFDLLQPIYKRFSSDSCFIVFLVIVSCSSKISRIFLRQGRSRFLVSNFTQGFRSPVPPVRRPSLFPAPSRLPVGQQGPQCPLGGRRLASVAMPPRRPLTLAPPLQTVGLQRPKP